MDQPPTEMEMRCARAFVDRYGYNGDRDDVALAWVPFIKVIIRAMRDPTMDMVRAGTNTKIVGATSAAALLWFSMIDAASPRT